MPELPEVETIICGLRDEICGLKITGVEVREEKIIGFPRASKFESQVPGHCITGIKRRGKYIIIELDSGQYIVIHLRMTGKLLTKEKGCDVDKHTHVIFALSDGRELRFNNIRKFGRVYLVDDSNLHQAGGLNKLGPEPLAEDFTVEDFKALLENRRGAIKPLLMKQEFIAGLGNIYTDEALFAAGIAPDRKANTLDESEQEQLYRAIIKTLKAGIKYCGTSVSDYVNSQGEPGSFQEKLQVYQKAGQECPHCGTEISKEKIGGRGTHFCPSCQE